MIGSLCVMRRNDPSSASGGRKTGQSGGDNRRRAAPPCRRSIHLHQITAHGHHCLRQEKRVQAVPRITCRRPERSHLRDRGPSNQSTLPYPGPDAVFPRVPRKASRAEHIRLCKATQAPRMVPQREHIAQMAPTRSRGEPDTDPTPSREAAR